MKRFENIVTKSVLPVFNAVKRQAPTLYNLHIEGKPIIQTVIAKFEEGKPILYLRIFEPITNANDRVEIRIHRSDCLKDCAGIHVFLGEFDVIDRYFDMHEASLLKRNPIDTVRFLVEMQINAVPDKVGLPIDIISITKDSTTKWIQCKQKCIETQPQALPLQHDKPNRAKKAKARKH